MIALSRLEENLFTDLDLNRYFFGGFPRNKPEDFEKFPYVYLPIFLIGIYASLKKGTPKELGFLLVMSLLLLAFIGNDNKLGPFILFPFFVLSIFKGFMFLEKMINKGKLFYLLAIIMVMLVFVLQISYGKN